MPLTNRLRLQERSVAAFTFTLAVDGWQLHFVARVWLQACDCYLTDGACYNSRTPWSFWWALKQTDLLFQQYMHNSLLPKQTPISSIRISFQQCLKNWWLFRVGLKLDKQWQLFYMLHCHLKCNDPFWDDDCFWSSFLYKLYCFYVHFRVQFLSKGVTCRLKQKN